MEQCFFVVGDFVQVYVIVYEVGYYVQNLMGILVKINVVCQCGVCMEGVNGLLVCQELQVDCFVGVWVNCVQQWLNWLELGDIEEVLNVVNVIGDDCL